MKNQIQNAQILIAQEYGKVAHAKGKKSVPAHDANLMNMLDHGLGMKFTIKLLDAWAKGWHSANSAAAV